MSEWIECNLVYEDLDAKQKYYEECSKQNISNQKDRVKLKKEICKDFINSEFNRAGVLIELNTGEQYLIGDINDVAGICNCCNVIDSCDIVFKYKIVYNK